MVIKGNKSSVRLAIESLFTTKKGLLRLLLVTGIIGIGASVPILSNYEWSGFGKDSNKSESVEETIKDGKVISTKRTKTEHFQSPKTLWDWLGLGGTIAIPVMIYVFQAGEQRRAEKRAKAEKETAEERAKVETEIADANLREEALQAYIDRMAEILIDKERRLELLPDKNNSNDTNTDNAVRDVARVRTVTILRRLEGDKERQGHVMDFLRDAELLKFILSGANLSGANLRRANLSGTMLTDANLSGTNLVDANLNNVDLSSTYFFDADLNGAILIGANLKDANLKDANLSGTMLTGANLSGAYLVGANLSGAILIGTHLIDAKPRRANLSDVNLSDANLSDAMLNDVDLRDANLSGANLRDANLSGADFTKVKGLIVEQIKTAKNWETAKYDPEFRSLLGLLPETPQKPGTDIQK